MNLREAKKQLKQASAQSSYLDNPLLTTLGGALGGGALSLLGSEFIGDKAEDDPEIAKLKKKRRRLKALLLGAGIGGSAGGLASIANSLMRADNTDKSSTEAAVNAIINKAIGSPNLTDTAPDISAIASETGNIAKDMLPTGRALTNTAIGAGSAYGGLAGLNALSTYVKQKPFTIDRALKRVNAPGNSALNAAAANAANQRFMLREAAKHRDLAFRKPNWTSTELAKARAAATRELAIKMKNDLINSLDLTDPKHITALNNNLFGREVGGLWRLNEHTIYDPAKKTYKITNKTEPSLLPAFFQKAEGIAPIRPDSRLTRFTGWGKPVKGKLSGIPKTKKQLAMMAAVPVMGALGVNAYQSGGNFWEPFGAVPAGAGLANNAQAIDPTKIPGYQGNVK